MPCGLEIQQHCPDLFKYQKSDWEAREAPLLFMDSVFAAFLRKIGQVKAANIVTLKLYSPDADAVGERMPLITELVRLHMPGLREVGIFVEEKKVFWDESPDYCLTFLDERRVWADVWRTEGVFDEDTVDQELQIWWTARLWGVR